MAKRKAGYGPEDMRRAEEEIGENIPESLVGLDTEDAGPVRRRDAPKR